MARMTPIYTDENESEEDIPSIYLCPITHELMKDPVILVEDGETYERTAIQQWLEKKSMSPLHGKKLRSYTLKPNEGLRKSMYYELGTKSKKKKKISEKNLEAWDHLWSYEISDSSEDEDLRSLARLQWCDGQPFLLQDQGVSSNTRGSNRLIPPPSKMAAITEEGNRYQVTSGQDARSSQVATHIAVRSMVISPATIKTAPQTLQHHHPRRTATYMHEAPVTAQRQGCPEKVGAGVSRSGIACSLAASGSVVMSVDEGMRQSIRAQAQMQGANNSLEDRLQVASAIGAAGSRGYTAVSQRSVHPGTVKAIRSNQAQHISTSDATIPGRHVSQRTTEHSVLSRKTEAHAATACVPPNPHRSSDPFALNNQVAELFETMKKPEKTSALVAKDVTTVHAPGPVQTQSFISARTKQPEEYYALYDLRAGCDEELSLKKGDVVKVLDRGNEYGEGWWHGQVGDRIGYVPHSYIRPWTCS